MLGQLTQTCSKHPRIEHVAEYRCTTLLPDGVRPGRVALRPRQLFIRDRLIAQPRKLLQQPNSRDLFFLWGRRDVSQEHSRKLMLARVCVNCVSEGLAVAQLVEKPAAQSTCNSRRQ